MKKVVSGLIAGLALGFLAAWFYLHAGAGATPAKSDAAAPAAAAPAEKPKENPLHMPPAKRTAAGVVLAKPTTASISPEVTAYGRVLDPGPFIALVTELETTQSTLAADSKELARLEKLFAADTNASAQAVETATAAVARDRIAVSSARARLIAAWGPRLATGDLTATLAALEKGRALVRLDVLPGDAPAPDAKIARIGLLGAAELLEADVIGAASTADPQLQGLAYFVVVRDRALPIGAALRATLPGIGEAQTSLVVPRSAIVYHEGSAWLYVLEEEDTFERRLVVVGRSVGDAVAVTVEIEDAHQVVVAGAQQILSAELQAGSAATEEK